MKTLSKLLSLLLVTATLVALPVGAQRKSVTLNSYRECRSRLNLEEISQQKQMEKLSYLNNQLLPFLRRWARREGNSIEYQNFEFFTLFSKMILKRVTTPIYYF